MSKTFRKEEKVSDYSLEHLPKTKPSEVKHIKKYVGGSKLKQLQSAYDMCEYSDLKSDTLSNKYYVGTLKGTFFGLIGGFLGLGWLSVGCFRAFVINLFFGVTITALMMSMKNADFILFFLTIGIINIFTTWRLRANIKKYNTMIAKAILDGIPPSQFPKFVEFYRNKMALMKGNYVATK